MVVEVEVGFFFGGFLRGLVVDVVEEVELVDVDGPAVVGVVGTDEPGGFGSGSRRMEAPAGTANTSAPMTAIATQRGKCRSRTRNVGTRKSSPISLYEPALDHGEWGVTRIAAG